MIRASHEPCGLLGFELGSDGANGHNLVFAMGESTEIETTPPNDNKYQVYMNGREVFKFASRVLGQSCHRSLLSHLHLQQASELKKVQKKRGCARASLGSLSESVAVFDSERLFPQRWK